MAFSEIQLHDLCNLELREAGVQGLDGPDGVQKGFASTSSRFR